MINTIISVATIIVGVIVMFKGKLGPLIEKLKEWWNASKPVIVPTVGTKLTSVDGVRAIDTLVALGQQNGNTSLVDAAYACGKALYTPKG